VRITSRRGLAGITTVGVAALVLAGCAPAPEESEGAAAEGSDFLPCIVSDAGGFDDNSFNELSLNGMQTAADELGADVTDVQSAAETDYGPNLDSLTSQGCNVIVTVGYLLAEATGEAATANADIDFAIVDDNSLTQDNVKPIIFDTAPAAFLAGYAAASYSETGVVGTFGGLQIPTVTIFMDGFAEGVAYFNEQTGEDVQVIGWDVASQTGSFTGGFEAGTGAQAIAQGLIDQNADVILPVGGPIYQSAIAAIRDAGSEIALIGVDADLYETDPDAQDIVLTSILKKVDVGVQEVTLAAANDEYSNEPFVGTLENDGVGIAPFHDFEDTVDPELADQLEEIRQAIIDGEITVTSASSPTL